MDDAAFSLLLGSRFSRFDGILVIVIVNAVGSITITAICHPFIVKFTAGLLSFGGSFNIIAEFRHLSLRCCYCHQNLLATEHLNEEPQEGPQEAAFVTISEGFYANGVVVIAHGEPAFKGLHGDLEDDRKWDWL